MEYDTLRQQGLMVCTWSVRSMHPCEAKPHVADKRGSTVQELAQQVVDAGAVPLLVLCVQEPELSLKRVAASALSDVAKHSPELAQAVVDAGAVAYLAPLVTNQDAKVKRQVRHAMARASLRRTDIHFAVKRTASR